MSASQDTQSHGPEGEGSTARPMSPMSPMWRLFIYLGWWVFPFAVPALILAVAYFLTARWPQTGIVAYALVTAAFLALFVLVLNASSGKTPGPPKFPKWGEGRLRAEASSLFLIVFLIGPTVVGYGAGVVIGFGQLFRSWQFQFGGFSAPAHAGYWDWANYSLSWVLDNVLANAGQIFGWDMTPIHPSSPGAQALVLGYNIALEFIVLAVVVRLFHIFLDRL